jgi:hypothetical protein
MDINTAPLNDRRVAHRPYKANSAARDEPEQSMVAFGIAQQKMDKSKSAPGFCFGCLTSTSLKGIPKIVQSSTVFQRILWTLAIVIGTGVSVYNVWILLGSFFSYSASLNVVKTPRTATFPDVTVCNLNPTWPAPYAGDFLGEQSQKQWQIVKPAIARH